MKFITIALSALLVAQAPAAAKKAALRLRGTDASEEHMKKNSHYAVYGTQQRFLKQRQPAQATTETGVQQTFNDLHPEFDVTAIDALKHFDEMAENGLELMYDGSCKFRDADGDGGNCYAGANENTPEELKFLAVDEILPLVNTFAQADGFELTRESLYDALTLGATHDPVAYVDHDLAGLSDRRRLSGTCPKVNSNQCMAELKSFTVSVLEMVYRALHVPLAEDVAEAVPDQCFIQSDWCVIEKWFGPLIEDNGVPALILNTFWAIGTLVPLHIYLGFATFTACGFQRLMSIIYDQHRWWHWAILGTTVLAASVTFFASGGLSLAAAVAAILATSGWNELADMKNNIIQYIECATA